MAQFVSSDKGDSFMKQAEKKLSNSTGFISSIFGQKEQRKEDAAELYTNAAAQYKISKCYEKAGSAYKKAAETQVSADDVFSAKQSWKECGKCYSHIDYKQAIDAYYNAIQIDLDSNRIRSAARLQHDISILLFENDDVEDCIISYQKAADLYEMEHDKHSKNKMLLMVAQLNVSQKHWETAATLYENAVKDSVDDTLLRWTVKTKLMNAALLRICSICDNDTLKVAEKWKTMELIHEEHCNLSDIYAYGRESKFIIDIVVSLKGNNIDEFRDLISGYGEICKVERIQMDLLCHILEFMKNRENDKVIMGIWLGEGIDDDDDEDHDEQPNPFQNVFTETDLKNAPDLDLEEN